jgi:hypothetical protein
MVTTVPTPEFHVKVMQIVVVNAVLEVGVVDPLHPSGDQRCKRLLLNNVRQR